MNHTIHKVSAFSIVGPYTLQIEFDDCSEQTIDFWPVLCGEMFEPLRDVSLFNQVQLDPEVHTIVWPNGADFDPATLHDWPEFVDEFTAQAREWIERKGVPLVAERRSEYGKE